MTPYQVDVLIQGFPGRAVCHGGLGWSTVTLIRGQGKVILLDVGAFGMRKPLQKRLKELNVQAHDVTDVILTHAHYDHIVNFTLFPNAAIWIGESELEWAGKQLPGFNPIPELYIQDLLANARVQRLQPHQEFLPYFTSQLVPGHTPGHLLFILNNGQANVIFTGDAAKNRAELMSGLVVDTDNAAQSKKSIELIFQEWRSRPGNLLIPGHDLTMRLNTSGVPEYLGVREAAITVWFSESVEISETINLAQT
jgi:glyoxylase-like metal-dependent hydrolase (beta-lactamase superfamily II)